MAAHGGGEETRKGPWTEQEDVQLVLCANVYGDRRWDFIAKVSGLKRTGKSCRLRWVNYLHPGLKRGKMTPHEERLVLELHNKWGNRWSRIARKLPGRTDNEIKNYWRTHMRKKAQEKKKGAATAAVVSPSASTASSTSSGISSSPTSSTSSAHSYCSSSVSNGNSPPPAVVESVPITGKKDRSFYDTGGVVVSGKGGNNKAEEQEKSSQKAVSSALLVDEIWKDMDFFIDDPTIKPVYDEFAFGGGQASCNFPTQPVMATSPVWDYFPVSLWNMDDDKEDMISKKFPPPTITTSDQFHSFYNHQEMMMSTPFLTG